MHDSAQFILSEIPDVRRIVETEVWLEGERRGRFVDHRDPAIRERVAEIILSGAGEYLRRKHDTSSRSKEHAPSPPRGSVLLVDDEQGILEFVGLILTEQGYDVAFANNGLEGWKKFNESSSWDLVILDRAMPGMSGEALGRKIKAEAPQIPLIMITGNIHAIAERDLFQEVLAKPFRAAHLVTCVSRAIDRRARLSIPAKPVGYDFARLET